MFEKPNVYRFPVFECFFSRDYQDEKSHFQNEVSIAPISTLCQNGKGCFR